MPDMWGEKEAVGSKNMTRITAYHTTTEQNAEGILKHGFRIPRNLSESASDSRVGVFFPAIFFARRLRNNEFYGDVVFKVQLNGKFMNLLPPKQKEDYRVNLFRSISAARENGFDGIDVGIKYDDIGIAVINPKIITIKEVKKI
jgi:hypothetical protein